MKLQNRWSRLGIGVVTLLGSGLMVAFSGAMPAKPAGGAIKAPALVLGPMVFVSNRYNIISGTPNGNEIWTMDANGGNPVRLTFNTWAEWEPQWNPQGTKIAFTRTEFGIGNPEIYVMDADGTNEQRLTTNPAIDFGCSWSPDGTKLAFHSQRDTPGFSEIYVMDASGDAGGTIAPVRLTNNTVSDSQPVWSPDGMKIAFSSTRDGNYEVYVMDWNGNNPQRLTNNSATDLVDAWRGDKIAFTSTRTGGYDIYTMNASNGSGLKRLTNNPADEIEPAWSPDGTKIVYYRRHDVENHEIYIMNADGKNQTRLTNNYPYLDADPSWKP